MVAVYVAVIPVVADGGGPGVERSEGTRINQHHSYSQHTNEQRVTARQSTGARTGTETMGEQMKLYSSM